MATRDGLAQIWYADANGVVTGYTPTADNVASAIIDAYNEHYGTDINIWTPETKTLQVGGSVPNWEAYEKIEMPQTLVAVAKYNNVGYVIGEIVDNIFVCDAMEQDMSFSIDNNGVVEEVGVGSFRQFYNARVKPMLETQFEIEGYKMNLSSGLVPGNTVPNWDKYIKIS